MTAAFFPDGDLARLVVALLAYAGVLLYGTSTVVRGFDRARPEAFVTLLYLSLFPLPSASVLVYFLQYALLLISFAALSALQVRSAVLRNREARAHRRQTRAAPLGWVAGALIFAPVALLVGALLGVAAHGLVSEYPGGTGIFTPAEAIAVVDLGARNAFWVVVAFGVYMVVGSLLDRPWLRLIGRIRLLSSDARFIWINVLVGLLSVCGLAVIVREGVAAPAARWSLVLLLLGGMLPAFNGLAWIYDAVFRRILTFHLLLAAAAVAVLGLGRLSDWLGVAPHYGWSISIAALALVAMSAPPWLDRTLERWLFPRAGEMRARVLAIAAAPLEASTRAEAGRRILARIVDVLDADGGAIVLEASATESAVVQALGAVDTAALGDTPAEVARVLSALPMAGSPCRIENLPLEHQLRLLRCGVMLLCPLAARRREATLVLGPRHGWLYDDAAVRALAVFSRQAALALENLALANARAHGEKLAALGAAAARIAHEIRNPLSAARSLVQLLAAAPQSDGLGEPALEELDRIGSLVTDLLLFARRDDLRDAGEVDLALVCRDALDQVAALAAEAGVEVSAELAEATTRGDRGRLVQVVGNLCRNAIEALAEQPGARRLAVRSAVEGDLAVVEVRDGGPGIPADELPRIFEPFCTTKGAGTGLGLAIARGIVEAHGGRIRAASTPGAETVFRVELPRGAESAMSKEP
jgi:signal transduction histidine kinase